MNIGLINKPKKSGATMRVWEIADAITAARGRKAKRAEVIDRYVSEGGNRNTASQQYHYWKAATNAVDDGACRKAVSSRDVDAVRITVGADGRIVIPAEMRAALRLGADGVITARVVDSEMRISTPGEALRRVQEQLEPLANSLKKKGISMVDELISDRREEARMDSEP